MKYPSITRIEPLLEAIEHSENKEDFTVRVNRQAGYLSISYRSLNPHDTFPEIQSENDALLRECRGITFDLEGNVISRPFHKFFNLDERKETQNIHLDIGNHICLNKLDGSMIHPIPEWDNGEIMRFRFATKAGITDVSNMAESYLNSLAFHRQQEYKNFIYNCIWEGLTPIFEFCSDDNRVVIRYEQTHLTLLAIRHNETGEYLNYECVTKRSEKYNIPVVEKFDGLTSSTLEKLKKRDDIEGVVIQLNDMTYVKVKTEWYSLLHKTKETINHEKNILKIILNDGLDDILSLMTEYDQEVILTYAHSVNERIKDLSHIVNDHVKMARQKNLPRKEVALAIKEDYAKNNLLPLMPIFWKVYDGNDARDTLIEYLSKKCGSQSNVDGARFFIGANYKIKELEE